MNYLIQLFHRRIAAVILLSFIIIGTDAGLQGGMHDQNESSQKRVGQPSNFSSHPALPPSNASVTNGPTWDGVGLWNPNNANNSTLTFPSNTIARFTNFQYVWPPAVSIVSKQNWTVQSRLVLLERVRAWNFTNISGGDAWETTLQWGSGSAAMAYGRDDTHSPSTGVQVGGQCFLGTLTTSSLIGQWITSNITLYGPTQTMYFSVYDS